MNDNSYGEELKKTCIVKQSKQPSPLVRKDNSVRRVLLISGGLISLVLGAVGAFLPVIPTTPFLLLSAWCWLRSSKRLHGWLLGHRIFGPCISDYLQYRAITARNKFFTLVFLWGGLGVSIVAVQSLHVRIALVLVGVAVSTHLFMLKTRK